MLVRMQRASPASTRCSGDHASSSGSAEPPSPLRAVPSRSTETAYENVFALVATGSTYTHLMSLAILGVTGFTGRLVLDEARRAGLQVRLVGRRGDALEALARAGEEVRVADARDDEALRAAFTGTNVVASLAGPFLELGLGPVKAAVDAGADYL